MLWFFCNLLWWAHWAVSTEKILLQQHWQMSVLFPGAVGVHLVSIKPNLVTSLEGPDKGWGRDWILPPQNLPEAEGDAATAREDQCFAALALIWFSWLGLGVVDDGLKLVLMNHHHNKRNTLNKTNHHKCSNKCDKKVRVAGGDGSLRLPCGVITHAGRYYHYFVITAVVTFISNRHHLYHYHD